MKIHRKAYGYFIRSARGAAELLVYTTPIGTLRFPGGTVDEGEDLIDGLYRELGEETGIDDFNVSRELGVHRYYKPDVARHVERHDFLLQPTIPLPDGFSFKVGSQDKDHDMVFEYHWMRTKDIHQLDWEFRNTMLPGYVPEFFNPSKS